MYSVVKIGRDFFPNYSVYCTSSTHVKDKDERLKSHSVGKSLKNEIVIRSLREDVYVLVVQIGQARYTYKSL